MQLVGCGVIRQQSAGNKTTDAAKNASANPAFRTAAFIACMVVIAASMSILSNPQSVEQVEASKKPKMAPHRRSDSTDVNFKKFVYFQITFWVYKIRTGRFAKSVA